MSDAHLDELESHDVDAHSGAVEDGGRDEIDEQILPVFASTEPFGYGGSPSDASFVGGDEQGTAHPSASKAKADREFRGPEVS